MTVILTLGVGGSALFAIHLHAISNNHVNIIANLAYPCMRYGQDTKPRIRALSLSCDLDLRSCWLCVVCDTLSCHR